MKILLAKRNLLMRKNILKLSIITFIVGVVFLALAFFFFHFVTDSGITLTWHEEAGKPFVTELIGDFGVFNIATGFVSLLIYFIFKDKKEEK